MYIYVNITNKCVPNLKQIKFELENKLDIEYFKKRIHTMSRYNKITGFQEHLRTCLMS